MTLPFRFDRTITLGNLVTFGTIFFFAVVGWRDLQRNDLEHDKRLAVQEATSAEHRSQIAAQAMTAGTLRIELENMQELMGEVRDELRTINRRAAP